MYFQPLLQRTILSSSRISKHPARALTTLPNNPHIYVFPHPSQPTSHLLSLLPTEPPTERLAVGSSTQNPPTPDSFTPNPRFLRILSSVLAAHAHQDPQTIAQAAAFASSSSSSALFRQDKRKQRGAGGGGGRGGFVHVSDSRAPPDYGRIAWPEDIFGSLEVDSQGRLVDGGGRWQESGTYRVVTREGILGLSGFLRERLVEQLRREEEEQEEGGKQV
ncbi:hypothetical protein B0O99DRAFT_649905 [Bisporella sp. PMI_857]|nr:hypothetical protein B0O99DRAFT_649905 [Bisporella sp. PMI_857]